jgi:hypothetical protein
MISSQISVALGTLYCTPIKDVTFMMDLLGNQQKSHVAAQPVRTVNYWRGPKHSHHALQQTSCM